MICKVLLETLDDVHICDFGGSQQFEASIEEALCYHPTHLHEFPESPYFVGPQPFNPFAADVYGMGSTFLECEEENERFGLPQLLDLFKKMASTAPEDRPPLAQAVNDLRRILLEALLYPGRQVVQQDVGGPVTKSPGGTPEISVESSEPAKEDSPEDATEESAEGASEAEEASLEELKQKPKDEAATEGDNAFLAGEIAHLMETASTSGA